MNGGKAQQARMDQAAVDALRPWPVPMPDMTAFERGEYALAREHLASLSPERRAMLERDWSA